MPDFSTLKMSTARSTTQTSAASRRVSVQVDYADYRSVGGVKFPFEYKFSWLDGRYTAKLKDVKTNVAIDAAKFGRPSAAQ